LTNEVNDEVLLENIEFTVKYIREKSSNGKFIKYTDFFTEPISLKEEDKETFFEKLFNTDEFVDITVLEGKENKYYYSSKTMTENYAKILYRLEEKDIVNMVAERIRNDSKRFPKTTNPKSFFNEPFRIKKDELDEIFKQFRNNDEYKDIKESKASNGVVYVYSDKYLTQVYADALTETQEVINKENP
jgi:hypothetical protein